MLFLIDQILNYLQKSTIINLRMLLIAEICAMIITVSITLHVQIYIK